ncbi:MAG: hypothetical protein Q8R13_04025 [bacterium]|nr:hypothetical protein [bacterium]MDZ4296300.1 hypothetical protein [Patescibacteria group bacterium]
MLRIISWMVNRGVVPEVYIDQTLEVPRVAVLFVAPFEAALPGAGKLEGVSSGLPPVGIVTRRPMIGRLDPLLMPF